MLEVASKLLFGEMVLPVRTLKKTDQAFPAESKNLRFDFDLSQ